MAGPSAHRSLLEFLTGGGSALIRAREHLLDLSGRVAGTGRLRPSQAAATPAPLLGLPAVDPGSVDLGASARSPLAGALAALLRGVLPSETAAEQVSLPTTDATASPATAPASIVATATATVRDLMAEHEHGPTSDHDQDHSHDHDHSDGVCAELPRYESLVAAEGAIAGGVGISAGTPLVAFADTFRLSSNPTARTTIYLDFDGHTTTGTSWNNATMGSSFYSPAYNTDGNVAVFSSAELTLIQRAWQRVAADFAPFDVNVTTMAPSDDWLIKTNASDPNYGIRVVMTSYGPSSSTAGGIAYIDSFNWNSDTPCFVYNTSLIGVSEAVSHEVGHTLGLSHDGTVLGGASYYSGHGSGESGWASIMGVGYYQSVTQWDNGTFYDSNNGGNGANYNKGPDDLAIITSYNGFGYLPDQEGNSQATANALSIQAGGVNQYGTIETRSDLDWYSFTLAAAGSINLIFDPYWYRTFIDTDGAWGGAANPYYARVSDASTSTAWADNGANLDLAVELYNSANVLLASANPAGLAASLNLSGLAADTYYLKLDGIGFGTPTVNSPTGYSDYASIGGYLISGTITGADALPEISLALGPSFSVAEDGTTNLVWTFSRTGDTSAELTVNVTLGGTATNATDFTLAGWSAGTVSFAAGQATATVTADPSADTTQESDETVSLQIASGSGYTIATTSAVVGTIANDDVPVVTLTVSPASVSEDGAPNLIYTFSRSYATAEALVVSYTVGGTASLGSDYTGPSTSGAVKTITIAANVTSATLTVNPTGDTVVEADETVALTLFTGFGYSVGTSAAVVGTITNDDLPRITLAVAPVSVAENGGTALVFTFSRDGFTTSALTVNYSVGGTATAGSDYASLPGSITFAAGSSTATVSVLPINDSLFEADETVSLTLSANPTTYVVGTSTAVSGTITNDDLPVVTLAVSPASAPEAGSDTLVFTFSRTGPTGSALTVNYNVGGTATAGSDYASLPGSVTFAAGLSTATVTIDPLSDALVENDETVEITLAAGSGYMLGTTTAVVGTIVNSDPPLVTLAVTPATVQENGRDGGMLFTFTRSGALAEALTVTYSVGGTATNGSDYTTIGNSVSFAAGAATATVLVTPLADALSEGDETVVLTLTAGSGYTVGTAGAVVATLTNVDLPLISLTLDSASVSEDGAAPLRFTFHRDSATAEPLTVAYAVTGTATAGSDYAPLSGTISFAAGASEAVLEVLPSVDSDMEADETVALTLSPSPSTYVVGTSGPVTGTITNDDLPLVTLAVAPASVNENSGTALVYSFSRTGPTTSALTVNYGVGGSATLGTDYSGIASTGSVKTVTFAAGAATATVNVTPIGDTTVEAHESVALTLQNGSGYAVGTTSTVVGTILNDDRPAVTLSLSPSSVTEGGSANLVYTFTRSVATADPLTVSYSVGGTATTGVDYTGITTSSGNPTVTIAGGAASAQVIVDPSDDTAVESNETVTLTLASGSDYTVGTTAGVSGTISNDDANPAPTAGADTLIFTPSQDILTGLGGVDTFQLIDLKNSLFVSGTTVDKVTTFVTTEDRFDSPFRTTAVAPTAAGSVGTLDASGIASRLNTNRFVANGAATFTFGSGSSLRTFLGINDNVAGYQSANDAIIEITGYSGALTSLRVL